MLKPLPVDGILAELCTTLGERRIAVLQAPPGAGKTTRVPPALLRAPWLGGGIVMLEPRRLAARAAAARIAEEMEVALGGAVGYRVRFENRVGRDTRIEVVTEGILIRRLQQDPELNGVGLVIFDEFHERHLDSDVALALCRDAMAGLREDLRLLVMSATLDAERLGRVLDAPVLCSDSRRFPVDLRYLPADPRTPLPVAMAAAVGRALQEAEGDVLAFLPGSGEIRRTREHLREAGLPVEVDALYGDMPLDAQQRAIQPHPAGRRRVVLATNIAETSLTIEGVSVVVDSGWMRIPRFDPGSGLTRLETVRVSRASAEQRAGRAGRLGPGVCYRLWNEATQRGLLAHGRPEISEADLAPLALELALWGVTDADGLCWIDAPPAGAMAQAWQLLQALGAVDEARRITAEGRAMAALPLHPRLAHMLLRARELGDGAGACDLAALLGERDPLRDGRDADLTLRLGALAAWRRGGRSAGVDGAACRRIDRVADQYRRLAGIPAGPSEPGRIGLLVALAYPDRIAARRGEGEGRYLMAGGRGTRLPLDQPLARHPLLAVAAVGGGEEGLIRLAAPLDAAELEAGFAAAISEREVVLWDAAAAMVRAVRERRLGALVLSSRPWRGADPGRVGAVLMDGIRAAGSAALPWDDAAREFQARVLSLRHWQPEADWPDLCDAALLASLEDWLAPYLDGITRLEQLNRLDLAGILADRLDWTRRRRLDDEAPAALQVPSGNRRRLHYRVGESPVLAVKLQEMFGLADTPRVAGGRVPVTLHLLSPAGRPIQVTQDLHGFWERTYAEVRKELKGRYPKHPWPDEPWSASPTAGTKRRR